MINPLRLGMFLLRVAAKKGSVEADDLALLNDEMAASPPPVVHGLHNHLGNLLQVDENSFDQFIRHWDLFRDAVLSGTIAGAVLGFLSVYIVLRRMVFVSAAVTQAAGLGVAFAFYAAIHLGFAFDPRYGAILGALIAAAVLVPDPRKLGLTRETMLGLVFAFSAGAAVLIGARITQEAHDIKSILFGYAVVVVPRDFHALIYASIAVMALQLWWYRGFTFASFDPLAARVQRLPVRLLDAMLFLSVGVMVGVTARTQGALPAFAFSTLPATAALLISRGNLRVTFTLATLFGGISGFGGYLVAHLEGFPVGSSQAVVATLLVMFVICARLLIRGAAALVSNARAAA